MSHPQSVNTIATTLLRVATGTVFLAHGLAKVFLYTIPGTVAFFESVGFPGILAYPVMVAEIVGGLMLIAGLRTRWAALTLVPVALGAVSVHWANGWLFNVDGGGWEFPAFLAIVAVATSLLEQPAALAVDGWLAHRTRSSAKRPGQTRPEPVAPLPEVVPRSLPLGQRFYEGKSGGDELLACGVIGVGVGGRAHPPTHPSTA